MGFDAIPDILLSGFADAELPALSEALRRFGRSSAAGDPVSSSGSDFVFAAAYDELALREARAASFGDPRVWCYCVPAQERSLVAAAASAHEGRMLLLPVDDRELRRALSALSEEVKERQSGDAAFSGLKKLEASFAWRTSELDIARTCRRFARLLVESGFYVGRSAEDDCALAFEEAFVNSVEHGNLGLDSSLRPEDPMAEDLYDLERARKLADPAYGGRLVRFEFHVDGDEARLILEDEGNGFDASGVNAESSGLEVSGRGFKLIKRPFDAASYNARGNRLTLVKKRTRA